MATVNPDPLPADRGADLLAPLLATQRRALRLRYLWHGLCLCVALPAAAVLLAFLLDHTLRLPLAIRLLHTAAIAALLGWAAWAYVRYPLSRRFGAADVAVLLERCFPDLHQRLVSAVQLQQLGELRNQSRAMIEALLAGAAEAARGLPLQRMFDHRRLHRLTAAAGLLLAGLLTGAAAAPASARAFVLRHLGFAESYPQATTLHLELPPSGPELQRTDRGDLVELTMPAGADLHVSVRVEGEVPAEVFLDVEPLRPASEPAPGLAQGKRSVAMSPRPGDRFRHVFRRLQGPFTFYARGGDDDHSRVTVTVRTVHPPHVATIRARIAPPGYTGLGPLTQDGGAIEALAGSQVEIDVATTQPVQNATMQFLENGRRLPLVPVEIQDDGGKATVLRARFVVEASDRYQVELVGDNGLRNPDPGTYPIAALQDYAPVGRWILPDDESTLLLPNALLCLRVEARDDFGLTAVDLTVDHSGGHALQRPLLAAEPRPTAAVRTELLELRELLAGAASQHEGLSLLLVLRDNRAPEAQATELPRRIVQVVDTPQLAEAIARAFRTLREEVEQAIDLQTDRRARLEELLAGPLPGPAEVGQVLTAAEVGQSRVQGGAERVHRGLMRAFDQHLWNRLDPSPHQVAVVDLYRAYHTAAGDAAPWSPGFYRDLAARRAAGTLGAMETVLDPILQMIAVADRLATGSGPRAVRGLAEAQVARSDADLTGLLRQVVLAQAQNLEALHLLLQRLEEWNDYQDLIQETRGLRDRQRDLQGRTEELRGRR